MCVCVCVYEICLYKKNMLLLNVLLSDTWSGMHNEGVPLGSNLISTLGAAQCHRIRKFWEFLPLRKN